MVARARPLNTEFAPELSTLRTALVPFEPCHEEMVPSSVAKMKFAGLGLKTWPSGAAVPVDPMGGGMVTTSERGVPVLLYNVASPVPLSETQNGLVGEKDTPHGLTRLGSVHAARPGMSETRFCWLKLLKVLGAE